MPAATRQKDANKEFNSSDDTGHLGSSSKSHYRAAAPQVSAVLHAWVQLSRPGNPPLERGAPGCGKELTPTRDLPGREKSVGKMSPWLVSGWSHHCPLPKHRSKSVVAAEPVIMVDYAAAPPGAQHSPRPRFEVPSSLWLWGWHWGSKMPRHAPRFCLL